jgi:signal transduction histidine kinase
MRSSPTLASVTSLEATRDVTERHQLEAERELLLGAVAHDLRSSFAAIMARADLVVRRMALGNPSAEYLTNHVAIISRAVLGMTDQIDQVLDLARLWAGEPLMLTLGATDLVALTHRIVRTYATTPVARSPANQTWGDSSHTGIRRD